VRTYHGEINKVVVKLDQEQRAVHNLEAEKRKSENMLKLLQVKLVEAVEEQRKKESKFEEERNSLLS